MNCFADVQVNPVLQGGDLPHRNAAKHIGIVLSNGFALLETASIVEAFQSANEIADSAGHGAMRYNVSLLSAAGGRIASSSSVFVWTDSVEARGYANDFDALFIAGGADVHHVVRDEHLLTWLQRACFRCELVLPVAEGLHVLEAAGFAQALSVGAADSQRGIDTTVSCHVSSPLHTALSVIEDDLGADVVRKITACFEPPASTQFTAILRRQASRSVSEPIRVSAQWLEANGDQPVAIEAAAQIATMSERNFLRRFKAEMGVTPSNYLLYVRLDMTCRLLAETTLPVDKIARRCGLGGGGQLAKLFRKHLAATPTEYRSNKSASGRGTI